MPLPKPNPGEDRNDFIGRCVSNETVMTDFPDQDQRVAVCISQFEGGKMDGHQIDLEELIAAATSDEAKFEDGRLHVAFEVKASTDPTEAEAGVFTGYGSIFGNKDLGGDIVAKGAFAKSIGQKGARAIKMLYQHRPDEPIGVWDEIMEDERGLRVKGRLALGTQRGREVHELMKMGAIDGLSIGYRADPKMTTYDEKKKVRTLGAVDLMEISAVTFPMNTRARVQSVKGADRTVREWEDFLRDAGNLSRSEAKAAASAVAKVLDQRDAVKGETPEVLDALNRIVNILKS